MIRRPIEACPLPDEALLRRHSPDAPDGPDGGYCDAYTTVVGGRVGLADYVHAFYTSAAFAPERLLLALVLRHPGDGERARRLGEGRTDAFSGWRVESRAPGQLLLADVREHTRSWLMVRDEAADGAAATRLWFGSAVLPRVDPATGRGELGVVFRALLGFHRVYSRVLLRSATAALARRGSSET